MLLDLFVGVYERGCVVGHMDSLKIKSQLQQPSISNY